MFLEIGKSYLKKFYNNNLQAAIDEKDGILWDDNRIKQAFNFGQGTKKDLQNHINNNKKYAYFVEVA
jgi:hypothetical protein